MASLETSKVGKRGVVVIPARMRRRFGLKEGSLVIAEELHELRKPILVVELLEYACLPPEIQLPEESIPFLNK